MKKYPNLIHVELFSKEEKTTANINGRWVPARPVGLSTLSNRFYCAWMVFTGKADALKWDEEQ